MKLGFERHTNTNGYVVVSYKPYVLEHRQVMQYHLGRKLKRSEHVHHKNGDKTDNRIENLEVLDASVHGRRSYDDHWNGQRQTIATLKGQNKALRAENTRLLFENANLRLALEKAGQP